jgi:hypothetical protein
MIIPDRYLPVLSEYPVKVLFGQAVINLWGVQRHVNRSNGTDRCYYKTCYTLLAALFDYSGLDA